MRPRWNWCSLGSGFYSVALALLLGGCGLVAKEELPKKKFNLRPGGTETVREILSTQPKLIRGADAGLVSYETHTKNIFKKYCASCHASGGAAKSKIFSTYEFQSALPHPAAWDAVVSTVFSGAMPSGGMPRPDFAEVETLKKWKALGYPQDAAAARAALAATSKGTSQSASATDQRPSTDAIVLRPTWDDNIGPLFAVRCVSCHDLKSGRTRLDVYALPEEGGTSLEAKWRAVGLKVSKREMPPGTPLSDDEILVVQRWLADGAPKSAGVASSIPPIVLPAVTPLAPPEKVDLTAVMQPTFQQHILPLMRYHCTSCHSGLTPPGNLRLDVFDDPLSSRTPLQRWSSVDVQLHFQTMPPKGYEALTAGNFAAWKRWVTAGFPESATPPAQALTCNVPDDAPLSLITKRRLDNVVRDLLWSAEIPVGIPTGDNLPWWATPPSDLWTNMGYFGTEHAQTTGALEHIPESVSRYAFAGSDEEPSFESVRGRWYFADDTAKVVSVTALRRQDTCLLNLSDNVIDNWTTNRATSITQAQPCVRSLLSSLGSRAYRRPLSTAEMEKSYGLFLVGQEGGGFEDGMRHALRAFLSSPYFLYKVELGEEVPGQVRSQLTDYEIAARLSFLLLGSSPDASLRAAAADPAKPLRSPQGRLAQVERLISKKQYVYDRDITQIPSIYLSQEEKDRLASGKHPRQTSLFRAQVLDDFTRQWLELDNVPDFASRAEYLLGASLKNELTQSQDTARELQNDARGEVHSLVHEALVERRGKFADLYTSTFYRARGGSKLNELYGVDATVVGTSEDPAMNSWNAFFRMNLPARQGILTRAGVVAQNRDVTIPVFRGRFVRTNLLCEPIHFPSGEQLRLLGITPNELVAGSADPRLPSRKQWEDRTAPPQCMTCHSRINGIGFALETLDSVGRFRTAEKVYNSSGAVTTTHPLDAKAQAFISLSSEAPVDGPYELQNALAQSDAANRCAVQKWFEHSSGRSAKPIDRCAVDQAHSRQMAPTDGGFLGMLKATISDPAFVTRRTQ